MIKKGDKKQRFAAEEIFYKLSLKKDFQEDLIKVRKLLGFPNNGFTKIKDRMNWLNLNNGKQKLGLLVSELFSLCKKYQVIRHWELMEGYIFFGENAAYEYGFSGDPSYFTKVLPPEKILESGEGDLIEGLYEDGDPYVKVLIFGGANKSNVLHEINKEWPRIEEILKKQGVTPQKRIRSTIEKDRNKIIHDLWNKPVKDLQMEVNKIRQSKNQENTNTNYKGVLIAEIMEAKGHKISDGYIRGLVYKK